MIQQLPATDYRNPDALEAGGVLVVGSGETRCQIAEELRAAGRETFLCVGGAGRMPRRYRGRDCIDWQNHFGWLDRTPACLRVRPCAFAATRMSPAAAVGGR